MNATLRLKLRKQKYDRRHRRIRAELAPWVHAGLAHCASCGGRIEAGAPWDLGHDDRNPGKYLGPEHPKCNQGKSGRNKTSREW
jgi:hypothetical protein